MAVRPQILMSESWAASLQVFSMGAKASAHHVVFLDGMYAYACWNICAPGEPARGAKAIGDVYVHRRQVMVVS